MTIQEIKERFNVNLNILEYNSLLCSIPNDWKKTLKNQNIETELISNT